MSRLFATVTLALLSGAVAPRAAEPPAQKAAERPELTLQSTLARAIETGQSQDFTLRVSAGDFVAVTLEQRNIDVVVGLVEPDDRVTVSVNECHADVCAERLIAIASTSGDYRIRVRASESKARKGRYTIRLDELRTATAADVTRVEAARAFEKANAAYKRAAPSTYEAALRDYAPALAKFRTVNDRRGELAVLLAIAAVNGGVGRATETLSPAKEAEQIARELNDLPSAGFALVQQGIALERMGALPDALAAYQAAAATGRAIEDRRLEGLAVSNEVIIYGRTGDSEHAIERSEYALALAKASGYRADAGLFNNMGIAYKNLGQYQKSLDSYSQALEQVQKDGRGGDVRALILNNMGNVERLLGRHREALRLHEQALELSQQSGGRDNQARSLNTIGLTYYALGDFVKALDYHQRALAIRVQTKDLPGQASSLNGEAKALHRLGETERAIDILQQALDLRRRIREPFGQLESLKDLAAVERDRGNLTTAIDFIRTAVDLEEALRSRITSPEVRTTFRAAEEDKYEFFIDLLQQAHGHEPGRGHDLEALTISERARSRVLLESLLDARVDLREGIDPELLARERTLQKQISDASTELSRALARSGVEGTTALSRRFDELNEQYVDVQADIRRSSPRYAAITQPQPATAAEIRDAVLDRDTVLLEFAPGDERSWLFAMTQDGLTSAELPARRTIDAAARAFYDTLTARQHRGGEGPAAFQKRVDAADAALTKAGQALSNLLFAGIAGRLEGDWRSKRLAIVAAGALESLPFGALPLPSAPPHSHSQRTAARLIDHHEIVTLPSASVLLAMRKETSGRQPARRSVAVFADPVFDASDPRVTVKRAASAPKALTRLPFSRQEAASIATIANAIDRTGVRQATDFAASRAALLDPEIASYRILHIATHGIVDAEQPARTALIFSLLDERGATRDGYVRMRDIYNMRLGADLVVLSACQTALGAAFKGEGLVGLARAFMYAGAPRIVASLWEVSDLATAELMKRFYRLMLQEGERPAAALRAAQREMAKDPRWSSPYYWAGFVIQGDWR